MLDQGGLSARMIADQLGHSRISMTQDVYMGRRVVDGSVASALEGLFEVETRVMKAQEPLSCRSCREATSATPRPHRRSDGPARRPARRMTCGVVGPVGVEPTTRGVGFATS
jgi:hypothetical protein